MHITAALQIEYYLNEGCISNVVNMFFVVGVVFDVNCILHCAVNSVAWVELNPCCERDLRV